MPTFSAADVIVATVRLNKKGNPELLEGKHDLPNELHFYLTERMVLEANGFIRTRWQKAHDSIMQDLHNIVSTGSTEPTL